MPESKRQVILGAANDLLALILTSGGYQTDLGEHVYFGAIPELGPDDELDALLLTVGDDVVTDEGGIVNITLPVRVHVLRKVRTLDGAWELVEAGLADVKKAFESGARSLGGNLIAQLRRDSTRTMPRETGSLMVGASIGYRLMYTETYGAP